MLCLDCVGGAAVLQGNLALPELCILLMSAPCLSPAAHPVPAQHPGSAACCGEASESSNGIQGSVAAPETDVIPCRDKLVLVWSMTLKAAQAVGSRQAAERGEKKGPCMCPWRR